MLKISHIYKTFNPGTADAKLALNDLCLDVNKGDFITVIGANGAGKSTMFNAIAGTFMTDKGEIVLDGKDVTLVPEHKRARSIGRLFQDPMLGTAPGMTVEENLALSAGRGGWLSHVSKADKKAFRDRVALLGMGLEDRMHQRVGLLSGGQRQRVAFARVLAPNPQLLLLDEPFAAIDAKVRKELRSWLREMIEKLGVTSIFVTHDQDEAIEVADEIIITNKGRIEHTGTPIEIYHNPKTAFTASFFGETTFVDDYSKFHNFEHIENVEKAIVRPEFVKVTKKNEVQKYKSSASHGVAKNVLFRGDSIEVVVDVDGTELKARRGLDEQAIEVGEEVDVFLYRIFVTVGDKAYLLDNKSISEDSLVI